MDLYPAIDLRGGQVVQLVGGDFDRETVHDTDPVAVAQRFESDGARWLHVVDLDAARSGRPSNYEVVAAIAAQVGVPVQVGGGIRSLETAEALARAGVARVVIGTAAVTDPELVGRVAAAQPVAVGLDVRGSEVAVNGWQQSSGRTWTEVLESLRSSGAEAVVVTQIAAEGLLAGPDSAGLSEVLGATDLDVIASGGVGSVDDLMALADLERDGRHLAGAIVGTAIYEGHVDVSRAVKELSRARMD